MTNAKTTATVPKHTENAARKRYFTAMVSVIRKKIDISSDAMVEARASVTVILLLLAALSYVPFCMVDSIGWRNASWLLLLAASPFALVGSAMLALMVGVIFYLSARALQDVCRVFHRLHQEVKKEQGRS